MENNTIFCPSTQTNSTKTDQIATSFEGFENYVVKIPYITTFYINNTKIRNHLTEVESDKVYYVNVFENEHIFIEVKLQYKNVAKLIPLDLYILDAIYTLKVAGTEIFTPQMILKTISGNKKHKASQQQIQTIIESINKLKNISIFFNCTNEFRARRLIKDTDTKEYNGNLLSVEEIKSTTSKKSIPFVYLLKETPILYQYAEEIHQIIHFSINLLSVKELSYSITAVTMKLYILTRIEQLKNSRNKQNNNVLSYEWYDYKKKKFQGMYHVLNFINNNELTANELKKKRYNLHTMVKKILTFFISCNYIKSYEVLKKRTTICGVKLILK